jgi:hypothetical protein
MRCIVAKRAIVNYCQRQTLASDSHASTNGGGCDECCGRGDEVKELIVKVMAKEDKVLHVLPPPNQLRSIDPCSSSGGQNSLQKGSVRSFVCGSFLFAACVLIVPSCLQRDNQWTSDHQMLLVRIQYISEEQVV